jgi:hypothetical protein
MGKMKLKVFEADTQIAEAEIFALDPPMCVAMANFDPTIAYDVARHANVIDDDYIADRTDILRIELANGDDLRSEAISIQDFPTLGERQVHILGIYQPSFDELFGGHPDFVAYWGEG